MPPCAELLEIAPAHDLVFPESPHVGAVAFSPDGSEAFVQLRVETIDPWDVGVASWPEVLGAVCGLAVLILLLAWWRVRRRRRRVGEPYCRRCNYQLTARAGADGDDAARCSECGLDLARRAPVVGRSTWRRLAPVLAPVALLLVLYAALHAIRLPRDSHVADWVDLSSERLAAWIKQRPVPTLLPFVSRRDRIVVVDRVTGVRTRRLVTRRCPTAFPMLLTPDGTALVLADGTAGVERVSVRTGRRRGRPAAVPGLNRLPVGRPRVQFSDDGAVAFIASVDETTRRSRLLAWDMDAGTLDVLVDEAAYGTATRTGVVLYTARRYLVLDGSRRPRVLSVSDFSEAHTESRYELRHYDDGALVATTVAPDVVTATAAPLLAPDGHVLLSGLHRGIVDLDLESGATRTISFGAGVFASGALALGPSRRYLFAAAFPSGTLVYDLETDALVARLTAPAGLIAPELYPSPDGRWLAAVPFRGGAGTGGGPFIRHVLLYDLGPLAGD